MKIIETVVLVLVAGILNFANGETNTSRMESFCEDNGNPGAYDDFLVGAMNFRNCVAPLEVEIVENTPGDGNSTVDDRLTAYCSKVGILSTCIGDFAETIKPCAGTDLDELIDLGVNSTALLLQFPCENRKLIKDLIASTDRECLATKMDEIEKCVDDFFSDNNQTSSSTETPNLLEAESDTSESDFDDELCGELQQFEECSVAALAGCSDQIFSTALQTLYKYFNNEIPCDNLPRSPKSASPTSTSAPNAL